MSCNECGKTVTLQIGGEYDAQFETCRNCGSEVWVDVSTGEILKQLED